MKAVTIDILDDISRGLNHLTIGLGDSSSVLISFCFLNSFHGSIFIEDSVILIRRISFLDTDLNGLHLLGSIVLNLYDRSAIDTINMLFLLGLNNHSLLGLGDAHLNRGSCAGISLDYFGRSLGLIDGDIDNSPNNGLFQIGHFSLRTSNDLLSTGGLLLLRGSLRNDYSLLIDVQLNPRLGSCHNLRLAAVALLGDIDLLDNTLGVYRSALLNNTMSALILMMNRSSHLLSLDFNVLQNNLSRAVVSHVPIITGQIVPFDSGIISLDDLATSGDFQFHTSSSFLS